MELPKLDLKKIKKIKKSSNPHKSFWARLTGFMTCVKEVIELAQHLFTLMASFLSVSLESIRHDHWIQVCTLLHLHFITASFLLAHFFIFFFFTNFLKFHFPLKCKLVTSNFIVFAQKYLLWPFTQSGKNTSRPYTSCNMKYTVIISNY